MCDLCEPDDGENCQDCGRLICLDVELGDDIVRPAYVTRSGDLFCDWCGSEIDRLEEEEADAEAAFEDPFEDSVSDADFMVGEDCP